MTEYKAKRGYIYISIKISNRKNSLSDCTKDIYPYIYKGIDEIENNVWTEEKKKKYSSFASENYGHWDSRMVWATFIIYIAKHAKRGDIEICIGNLSLYTQKPNP